MVRSTCFTFNDDALQNLYTNSTYLIYKTKHNQTYLKPMSHRPFQLTQKRTNQSPNNESNDNGDQSASRSQFTKHKSKRTPHASSFHFTTHKPTSL